MLGLERDWYKNEVLYASNRVNRACIDCWVCRARRREGLQDPIQRNVAADSRKGRGSEVHNRDVLVALAQTLTLIPLPLFTRALISDLSVSHRGKRRAPLPRALLILLFALSLPFFLLSLPPSSHLALLPFLKAVPTISPPGCRHHEWP